MTNVVLYTITVLIWGSTWLGINFQLGEVAPEVSVVYRYAIASAALFAWCALRGLGLRFEPRAHLHFALLGVCLFGLNYIATYRAQLYIPSAVNAVVFSSMMWLNIINARIFFKLRADSRVWTGAALGVAGIVTLFWPEVSALSLADTTLLGAALCFTGAFIASLGNMVSQRAQREKLPVMQSNAWGMLYGTLLTGAIALAQGHPFNFDSSPSYVISLLYLAIFGSIVGFGTYLTLLGRIGASRAGYAVVMFPAVALILSVLFENLELEGHMLAGIGLVLAGNLFILSRGRRGSGRGSVPPGVVLLARGERARR